MTNKIGSLWAAIKKGPSSGSSHSGEDPKKTSVVLDVLHLSERDKETLREGLTTLASGKPVDDKELLLEHGVSLLQKLPADSGLGEDVGNAFITGLWNDLPHPAATVAGPTAVYRRHDGGGNNPWSPEMGKAGSPYCRSVPPLKPKGPNLPDVNDVFEALLRREGLFRKHPSGLNRMFFSFATVVIHECFQTSRKDQWINETSSYVDLSTLYGNTEKEQPRVRTYKNGTIYPDSIASDRIMMMPPGVVAVLILFSRNHNQIAANLLSINEAGLYDDWDDLGSDARKWQDEDIFQLSRNINVGYFASVVLKDYVAAILNTPRRGSEWWLDLGKEIKEVGKRVDRAGGNVVSVEFAVLYHWHAALSAADETWMEQVIRDVCPDLEDLDEMTIPLFEKIVMTHGVKLMSTPAREWTFGGLKRQEDGSFKDSDLAGLIKDCIEEPAHAFGAHGTPLSLKIVDILGQLQARNVFNCCTLNELRRYLNLKPYETFAEWNEDTQVARDAESLYGHIDNLELYPGLMAECTKPAIPGSGVCPGQTTGRGILDDAVSLVRGDRYLTYDFNSNTLTNWGASKLKDFAGGSYGGMLPKMLYNALPWSFTGTSSYALLPFYTPDAAKGILTRNKVLQKYDTARSPDYSPVLSIQTQAACKLVFEDRDTFRVMYQAAIKSCTNGHDFMIGWDDAHRHNPRSDLLYEVFFEQGFEKNVTQFFATTVRRLISEKSIRFSKGRSTIDIVKHVTNVTPILWLAERFALPLKTEKFPHGLLTIDEAFKAFLVLFMYQSFNIIPPNEWLLREGAMVAAEPLRLSLETNLKTQDGGMTEQFFDAIEHGTAYQVTPDAQRIFKALRASKLPIGDNVGDCLGMSAPVAGNLTQQASLLIDLFLSPGYESYKSRIVQLALSSDPDADKELQGYVFEGMRHAGVVPGLPRIAARDITITDGPRGPIHIKAGQTILVATSKAAMDPIAFPNPEKLDPFRPMSAYTLLGHGLHYCFGVRLVGAALTATLREVFRLKNLRRAEGRLGQFAVVEHWIDGVRMRQYLDGDAKESPIPTTLTLEYDA